MRRGRCSTRRAQASLVCAAGRFPGEFLHVKLLPGRISKSAHVLCFGEFCNVSRPQKFSSEIAGDRAKIPADLRLTALSRYEEVRKHCAESRRAAEREIPCDLRRISDRKFCNFFRGREIFELFFVRNRGRSRRNPCRSAVNSLATSRRGPQALCGASAC